jgi:hypothetical protein
MLDSADLLRATWSAAGVVTGSAAIAGLMSSVFSSAGTITGSAAVDGKMSSVLGTVATIDTGGGGSTVLPVFNSYE